MDPCLFLLDRHQLCDKGNNEWVASSLHTDKLTWAPCDKCHMHWICWIPQPNSKCSEWNALLWLRILMIDFGILLSLSKPGFIANPFTLIAGLHVFRQLHPWLCNEDGVQARAVHGDSAKSMNNLIQRDFPSDLKILNCSTVVAEMMKLFRSMGLSSFLESTAFAFCVGGSHGLHLIHCADKNNSIYDFNS